jgi:chromate transport protein ChrA
MPDASAERPDARQLFPIFARIGPASFGGGPSCSS